MLAITTTDGEEVLQLGMYDLACDIIDTYTFYPMAMYDLLNIIKPYLDGPQAVDINIKEKSCPYQSFES